MSHKNDISVSDGTETKKELQRSLESLDTALETLEYKISDGRIRDLEKEKVRIQYHRALGYLIRTKMKVLEGHELVEMEERLQVLEKDMAHGDHDREPGAEPTPGEMLARLERDEGPQR